VVPARLSLRNFLCYRECPSLDLEHVRLACLTGENGNGKSALLDAITWALWGRARGRDGDLISLGQTDMEVEFEFYAGEARYRVIRKCRRAGVRGTTHTSLEFFLWDGVSWKVQSGSTQAETQRAIVDVLRIGYETFINSAFLIQGKADLFTVKSPGERKQVLAEILNLAQYDVYEERAKERRNECARAAEHLERQVHDAEFELKDLPDRREERAAVKAELDEEEASRGEAAATLDALRRSAQEAQSLRRDIRTAEHARDEAQQMLAAAETQIALRRAEIDGYEALVAERETIRDGFDRLEAAREELRKMADEADRVRVQIADAERVRDDAARELAAAESRIRGLHDGIERYDGIVAEAAAIRDGYSRLQSARAALAEQDRRAAAVRELERRLRPLEDAIARAEADLRAALKVKESEAGRLEALAGRVDDLRRERAAAAQEQIEIDAAEKRLKSLHDEEAECRGEVQSLQTRNARLRAEMDELKRKFDELKAAVERGEGDCPLCRSNLGHDGLRRIEESYQAEGREKAGEYRDNQQRIREREASAQARAEEARRLETSLQRRRDAWKSRTAVLERDLDEAERAGTALVEVQGAAERIARDIAEGNVAREERARADALRAEIAAAGYDEQAHERARRELAAAADYEQRYQQLVRAESELASARTALASEEEAAKGWRRRRDEAAGRAVDLRARLDGLPLDGARRAIDELAPYDARHQELLAAETKLPIARDALASQEGAADTWRRQRDEAAARLDDYRGRLAPLADVEERIPAAEARLSTVTARCHALSRALGAVEQEIDRLEGLERDTRDRRRRLEETKREHGIYEELVRAFGRRGAQALIIESALPEIEDAANELLARMTNNRMHVTLETQRQNQKGTVTETLEIKIADEWGTRSYEMFSGGEAFRINLALRIALSKLLARRAGAPLPTLVIDEGFGTQDAAGRERLIDAITAIQDDFQCLLVVTHIDELKDQFDTRIEVAKNGDGSTARVVMA
jgi:exonuclease SbcC